MTEVESPYLWSTTALTNGSVDPNINFAEGQLPGTVNNSSRSVMAGIARRLADINGTLTTAGSANAYTIAAPNISYASLRSGLMIGFKASFTNTAAATLAVNGLTAKSIRVIGPGGERAIVAGQIVSGGFYQLQYSSAANSAAGGWILLNPVVSNQLTPEHYLAAGDGTTDDTAPLTNWLAALASSGLPGKARPGATYKTITQLTINTSNTIIDFAGATIKPTNSSASFIALSVIGGALAGPTLSSNMAAFAHTAVVSTTAAFSVSSGIVFEWTDALGYAFRHIAKITAISGTVGGTLTFDAPIPMAVTTVQITSISSLDHRKNIIIRNLVIDGTNVSGTGSSGILPMHIRECLFENLTFRSWTPLDGVAFYPQYTARCTYRNLNFEDCGNNQGPDLIIYISSDCEVDGIFSSNSHTFGPQIDNATGMTCSNVRVEGCNGRSFKISSCLHSAFTNIVVQNAYVAGGTGLAIANSTRNCVFSNVIANGDLSTGNGVWFSDQSNLDNIIIGLQAHGNSTNDLFIGASDTGNRIIGANVTLWTNSGAATIIGLNGGFGSAAVPTTTDGAALGTTALQWSDLFLASGAVVNFNNGDVTITHGSDALTFAGAANGYTFDQPLTFTSTLGAVRSKSINFTRDLSTATGSVAYTGAGFKPSAMIVIGYVGNTATSVVGAFDSSRAGESITRYGSTGATEYGSTSVLASSILVFLTDGTAGKYQTATITSWDSDGFTLSWTKTSTPTGTVNFTALLFR
jgi:hypothetical protein